jgi:hypothetical protein
MTIKLLKIAAEHHHDWVPSGRATGEMYCRTCFARRYT